MKRFGLGVLVLTAALATACNTNKLKDDDATIGTAGSGPVAEDDDRRFVERMLDANLAEIDLARLAADRATNPDVKQFAQMMIADHSTAGESLDRIASRQGIPALAQREEKHREVKDKLAKLRGAEFDREYMAAMVDDHEEVYDMLRSRVDVGNFGDNKGIVSPEKESDAVEGDVNQWAAGTIASVKRHLDEARQIQDRLKDRNTTN